MSARRALVVFGLAACWMGGPIASAAPFGSSTTSWVWRSFETGVGSNPNVVSNTAAFWWNASAGTSPNVPTTPSAQSTTGSAGTVFDAYLNLGAGPYPESASLTTGGAQAWYLSPVVEHLFGGVPNVQQRSDFANQVLQDVQQSFDVSHVPVTLTLDSNQPAAHTVSLVSGTTYQNNPNIIGIADVGKNGFTFVDTFTQAQSITDLASAVAHNLAHELMHSFGVPEQPQTTGYYVDNEHTNMSILTTNPLPYSPSVVKQLLALNFLANGAGSASGAPQVVGDDDRIEPSPVPEPASCALWGIVGLVVVYARRRLGR